MLIFNIVNELYTKFGHIFTILFQIVLVMVPLLISMAYLTLAERKIIAAMQMRQGPSIVGPFGLLQPFADALKLILKEVIIPSKADWKLFIFGPILTFALSLICWAVIPLGVNSAGTTNVIANINIGVLYLIAISSLSVYGVIIAGWASNSKYAFLGAIRSAAQMISYEISIGFSLMLIIMVAGSLNLSVIVNKMHEAPFWIKLLNLPMCFIFFVSILAETNRHPFDLPEAEAELVAGYNVEYSSMAFALFYLGEYLNMILSSAMITMLFLGGWFPPLEIGFLYAVPGLIWMILKMLFILFIFIWIRAALPRYRYDQLMRIGWKFFMPLSLVWLIIGSSILFFTNSLGR